MRPRRRFIDYRTAVSIVVASMVGTGVFTTLGVQVEAMPDGAVLLLIWLLGGVGALCGALCYAELAAAVPRSGGEYHFLSRTFHPALGQLAGWVSVTVGFSAPVALAAMALGRYVAAVVPLEPMVVALGAVLLLTLVHGRDLRVARLFQLGSTLLKVVVILLFCAAGMLLVSLDGPVAGGLTLVPGEGTLSSVLSAPFAISLIYVSYAYSGWNAAAYVVDEVRRPEITVPRALVHGTLAVTVLYLMLNLTFLLTVSANDLAGRVEVGALAAGAIFGPRGGLIMSLVLATLLLSTISAMVLAGPRVLQSMGEDLPGLGWLAALNRHGAPTRAVLLQQGLAVALILTDSFEGVLTIAGFTLVLFALLTVLGLVRLRIIEPDLARPFKVPLYPLPPLVFLVLSGVGVAMVAWERPVAVAVVCLLLACGGWLALCFGRPGSPGAGVQR